MKPSTKKATAIVGVSVLSLGLVIGTGFAANAATVGIAGALHHTVSLTPSTSTSTPTPTPIRTHGPRGNDANNNHPNDNDANDDNGRDATEHPTPEPGDDDAPGTPDHHRGNDVGNDNRGSNRGPGNGDGGHDNDGAGHDAGDDNG
ncbi:MAG: hypothetical protein QOH69_371 [Actinomycetota bacterium]|jgi:hypothetical protein|nr:hypothetical protein [Actinomycetota bacterium]